MLRYEPVVITEMLPPRKLHSYFGQIELRSVAALFPKRFVEEILEPGSKRLAAQWVMTSWKVRSTGEDYIEPNGLTAYKVVLSERYSGAIVSFPQPERMPEPYFAAIILDKEAKNSRDTFRYITLNATLAYEGEACTSLGEWRGDSHLNYGPGPDPNIEDFTLAVARLLGLNCV